MYSWQAETKSMAVFSRLSFCRYLIFIQSNADLRARMCDVAVCIINEGNIYLPSCKISSPPALARATLWLMLYWYRLLDFIFHNVDFQLPILLSTTLHTPFSSHHIPCFILSCVFVLTLICRPNVGFWTRNASKLTASIACRRRSGCIVYWSLIRAISVVGDWPLNENLHCW